MMGLWQEKCVSNSNIITLGHVVGHELTTEA